jgi:hypothetical protein
VKENLEDADTNGGEDAFMEVCNNLLPTKENLLKKKKKDTAGSLLSYLLVGCRNHWPYYLELSVIN